MEKEARERREQDGADANAVAGVWREAARSSVSEVEGQVGGRRQQAQSVGGDFRRRHQT